MMAGPQITAPYSEDWARWRGEVSQSMLGVKESLDDLRTSNREAIESLRADFHAVVAGDVECKIGQRLRTVEGRVWKIILLAIAAPFIVAFLTSLALKALGYI